ncbi:hypothetical protein ACFP9U_03055 [Nitratireductor sp. GCM10026969]
MSSRDKKSPQGDPKARKPRVGETGEQARKVEEARDTERKLTIWSVIMVGLIVVSIFAVTATFVLY